MLLDGNDIEPESDTLESDIVIVGAGTIGLYMAARLLKDSTKRNICIVESGDIIPRIESNFENSQSIGRKHTGTLYGRYSGLGGTSFNWGGQLAEFEEADFERNDSKWPIGYKEMNYYYNEVYSFFGLTDSISTSNFDRIFNNKSNNNYKIESYYTIWLKNKQKVFADYFDKEINDETIKIITNTTAHRINFNKNIANELICRSSKGRNISIKANKYIFASGTLGINQFFLSTKALHNVPWKSNENIGKYFQDHIGGEVGYLKIEDEKKFRKLFEQRLIKGIKITHKLKFRKEYRKALNNGVVMSFKYHSKDFEFKQFIRQLRNKINIYNVIVFLKHMYRNRRHLFSFLIKLIFHQRIHILIDKGIEVYAQTEQIPIAESRIAILKDKLLENDLFKIVVDWNWNGTEIEAIRSAAIELKKYLKEENIGDFYIDNRINKKDMEVLNTFRDTNHQCGGMRMSTSNEGGVVDPNCKVWGTANVWVAGAAVFPSSSHANSTLTALALSERIIQNSF